MILDIKHLRLAYGTHVLAPDVSFHLEGGECVLLAGANGCGKSTLLKTLAGEGIVSQTASASLRPLPTRNAPGGAAVGPSRSGRDFPPIIPEGISALAGHGRGWPWVCDTIPSSV